MNSTASQSSSSGWLGYSPCNPRSPVSFERPMPKSRDHRRLAKTRAVRGLSRATIQCARSRRVARRVLRRNPVSDRGGEEGGGAGSTTGPDLSCQSPRLSRRISRGFAEIVAGTEGMALSDGGVRLQFSSGREFGRGLGLGLSCARSSGAIPASSHRVVGLLLRRGGDAEERTPFVEGHALLGPFRRVFLILPSLFQAPFSRMSLK